MGAAPLDAAVEDVDVAEEAHHEGRGRMVEDFLGRADLLDRPWFMTTTRSATSRASSWSWVTKTLVRRISSWRRRSQRRSSWRTLASREPKGSSRSSTLRLDGEGAGQGHALALAAGELRGVAVGQPVELHELQQVRDLLPDLRFGGRRARGPHAQAEGHVLEHGHVAEQGVVLEHEADAAVAARRAPWRPRPRRGPGRGRRARGRR